MLIRWAGARRPRPDALSRGLTTLNMHSPILPRTVLVLVGHLHCVSWPYFQGNALPFSPSPRQLSSYDDPRCRLEHHEVWLPKGWLWRRGDGPPKGKMRITVVRGHDRYSHKLPETGCATRCSGSHVAAAYCSGQRNMIRSSSGTCTTRGLLVDLCCISQIPRMVRFGCVLLAQ